MSDQIISRWPADPQPPGHPGSPRRRKLIILAVFLMIAVGYYAVFWDPPDRAVVTPTPSP